MFLNLTDVEKVKLNFGKPNEQDIDKMTITEAKKYLEIGHPRKGPLHRRRPDRIVRRTIRGMLPRRKPKGKQAYKRLKVFLEIPEELKDKEMQTIPLAKARKLRCPYITVGELAKEIGWTPIGE